MQLDFNTLDFEPVTGGNQSPPIPDGLYHLICEQVETKQTKAAPNKPSTAYLEITFLVNEQEHPEARGKRIWERLNCWHDKEETRKIARGVLRRIHESMGIPSITETRDLLGGRLIGKVTIEPERVADGKTYPARNAIKGYRGSEESSPTAKVAPPTAQPGTAPSGSPATEPFWMKKA